MKCIDANKVKLKDATTSWFPMPVVSFWVSITTFLVFTALLRSSESILSGLIMFKLGHPGQDSFLLAVFVWLTILCSFWTTIISTVVTLVGTLTGKYQMQFAVYQLVGYLAVGLFLLAMLLS